MSTPFVVVDVKIGDITIEDRARSHYDEAAHEELKQSIDAVGLLHPIILDENKKLISGERRLRACTQLGHATISARIIKGLSPHDKLVVEFVENKAREPFLWHEEDTLIAKIYNQAKLSDPQIGVRSIAIKYGVSHGTIQNAIKSSMILKQFPSLINVTSRNQLIRDYEKIKKQAVAIRTIQALKADNISLSNVAETPQSSIVKLKARHVSPSSNKEVAPVEEITPNLIITPNPIKYTLHTEQLLKKESFHQDDIFYSIKDNMEYLDSFKNETICLAELDPPYAIDFNKTYGKAANITSDKAAIDWTQEKLYKKIDDLLGLLYFKLMPDTWTLLWCGREHINAMNDIAKKHSFGIQHPGIWAKPGGSANAPNVRMISNYEVFLLLRKGKATFATASLKACLPEMSATGSRIHQWEKPIIVYDYIFKAIRGMSGGIMISLFAGSGNAMLSAKKYGMIPHGCDICGDYYLPYLQRYREMFGSK